MTHYFAYGNLMDIDVMRRIAPSAKAIAVARLRDHQIGFAKCSDPSVAGCTLDPVAGAEIWGVHYELSDVDMATLDKAAGVPLGHWEHRAIVLEDAKGERFDSVTYVIPTTSGPYAPPATYVAPIYKGARDFDLPAGYVSELQRLIVDAQKGAA